MARPHLHRLIESIRAFMMRESKQDLDSTNRGIFGALGGNSR
jgi:hypothetical protein